jgi:hypothetical protein
MTFSCAQMGAKGLFLAFCVLETGGCTFTSDIRMNVPDIPQANARIGHEIILSSDIDVNIYPYNGVKTRELSQVVMIPVWLDTEVKPLYKEDVFRIRVAFRPKERGFAFRPKDVSLTVSDLPMIKPSRSRGPFRYVSAGSFEWAGRMAAKGWVVCARPSPDTPGTTANELVGLDYVGIWNCLELEFDIEPPDPSRLRSIRLDGIMKNGQYQSSIEIPFREIRYHHADSFP